MKKEKEIEMLVVRQGFEDGDDGKSISDFSMDDFRRSKVPHHRKGNKRKFRAYFKIERHPITSECPWAHSRWISGRNGKLKMFDNDWDRSG